MGETIPASTVKIPSDLAEDEEIKPNFSIETMIDAYAHHYGIDPQIVEQKDIMRVLEFTALRNRESVMQFRRLQR